MVMKTGNPAVGAAGSDGSLLGGFDASEINPRQTKTQGKIAKISRVDWANRELLLEAIDEAADDLIEYAEAVRRFVFERDRASLFPAINGVLVKAIAMGAAGTDLRKLVAAPSSDAGGAR